MRLKFLLFSYAILLVQNYRIGHTRAKRSHLGRPAQMSVLHHVDRRQCIETSPAVDVISIRLDKGLSNRGNTLESAINQESSREYCGNPAGINS